MGVKKTTMGWLMPFTKLKRSSWVSVSDGFRNTIVAGFPPNASWVNAFAIAKGYDLGVGAVDDTGDQSQGFSCCFTVSFKWKWSCDFELRTNWLICVIGHLLRCFLRVDALDPFLFRRCLGCFRRLSRHGKFRGVGGM